MDTECGKDTPNSIFVLRSFRPSPGQSTKDTPDDESSDRMFGDLGGIETPEKSEYARKDFMGPKGAMAARMFFTRS